MVSLDATTENEEIIGSRDSPSVDSIEVREAGHSGA